MEKILDMVNKNIQDTLKKFKTPKIKNMKRYRNKYMNSESTSTNTKVKQSTTQNIKEELNKDMENLRKKN
jgi:hypothetical protein